MFPTMSSINPIIILVALLYFAVPVLVLYVIIRLARQSITPQQREEQKLLQEAVDLLRENNQLLSEFINKSNG